MGWFDRRTGEARIAGGAACGRTGTSIMMPAACLQHGRLVPATFELFVRKLPEHRALPSSHREDA
ncbi:MAG: hypothetical protein A2Y95_06415 [Deltaproteobacteria bacterium RBG_13_65_10]|nr:MAG: hypothetical protein A2Y95_06415 [Deltaproteobacteria bacterium RBG_13_65_10]